MSSSGRLLRCRDGLVVRGERRQLHTGHLVDRIEPVDQVGGSGPSLREFGCRGAVFAQRFLGAGDDVTGSRGPLAVEAALSAYRAVAVAGVVVKA